MKMLPTCSEIAVMHILLHVTQLPVDIEHQARRTMEFEHVAVQTEVIFSALVDRPHLIFISVWIPELIA